MVIRNHLAVMDQLLAHMAKQFMAVRCGYRLYTL